MSFYIKLMVNVGMYKIKYINKKYNLLNTYIECLYV